MLVWALAIAIGFMILERVVPDQKLPAVKGWWTRVIFVNAIQGGVVLLASLTWDVYLERTRLTTFGSQLSAPVGGLIGYLVLTFVYYWWHRVRHTNNFLWLACHQLHHSPSRIETITSFYKHPLEILMNSIIISTTCHVLLGFSFEQVAWTNFISAVGEYVYHMNIKTPHIMGYFFQRPEMHRIHHQRGLHFYNFSDIPLWDMMFGTFRNPKENYKQCGFAIDRELRLKDMLLFRNVNNPFGKEKRSRS
jgi:sterol desaturase/sphingolipid hydroxylase (fatty acid hydroxylase superfamily)